MLDEIRSMYRAGMHLQFTELYSVKQKDVA